MHRRRKQNRLDEEQGRWLLKVSKDPGPKILITGGKPIYVNGKRGGDRIAGAPEGYDTVNSVVLDPQHHYLAAIGGDTHNYQRYPVPAGDVLLQCIVTGGGGAFAHATHTIGRIDPSHAGGVSEEDFRCYPLRRDSLAAFSRVIARKVFFVRGDRVPALSSDQAALSLATKLRTAPLASRPTAPAPSSIRSRAAAAIVSRLGGKVTQRLLAPVFRWEEPPFFKHFLRFDVRAGQLRARCFGVTGCAEHDDVPQIEDEWTVQLR